MLKKFFIFSIFALATCAMVQAQKERMYVRAFTYGSSVSAENCEKVRAAVFGSVNASERFELLDAFAVAGIAQELEKRQSEAAVHDEKSRTELVAVKANDYIMDGDVSAVEIKSEVKDGKTLYTAAINYSITITKIADNTTVATKSFSQSTMNVSGKLGEYAGSLLNNDTPEKAVNEVLKTVDSDIKKFIEEEFPLTSTIYGGDFEIKKDKLVQCYINIGANVGVTEGLMFDIYEIKIKVGKESKTQIGSMKIVQVDEEIALGKVTKGGKEVKLAMDRYLENKAVDENTKPLVVISRPKKGLFGLGNIVDTDKIL